MDPHTKASPFARPDGVALPRPAEEVRPPAGDTHPHTHTTDTIERGAFCLAVCTCGWKGPARRSRDLARKDAAGHGTE
ncbi:hypothetical protein ACFV7Q_12780 [Streptomyces sp. NPDC059851]|uniref:hypothetical protein n=1 Tax=Streptomyces sp. NPDC059851 TaxID=3346971 RepID=UPI003661F103